MALVHDALAGGWGAAFGSSGVAKRLSGPQGRLPTTARTAPTGSTVIWRCKPLLVASRAHMMGPHTRQSSVKCSASSSTASASHGVYQSDGPGLLGWESFDSSRFQFKETLGKGGWGTVHLAVDTETGQEVAIKVQTKWPRSEPGKRSPNAAAVIRRIQHEGDLLLHMQRSKRVVKLLHRCEDKDNAYLVTEVLRGGDLEAMMTSSTRRMTEQQTAQVMKQVLLALRDCHVNGVCYTDVKPANFMLVEENDGGPPQLKLIDFGCAQVVTPNESLSRRCGTPVYFAPEVFQRSYGCQADVWSAGVMMYRFLSGRLPWFPTATPVHINPASVMASVLNDEIPFTAPVWRYKSDQCVDLLKRLLNRSPNQRVSIDRAIEHPWIVRHCCEDGDDEEMCVPDKDATEEIRRLVSSNVVPMGGRHMSAKPPTSAQVVTQAA